MKMGTRNPIFKINDRVMFKIMFLDWLNVFVLREQK